MLGSKLMWNDFDGLRSSLRPPSGTDAGLEFNGIQPNQGVYEDLARDRLAVANAVLEFLRLPQLDADDLPPVRYRKQADSLTERYVDLVRAAMRSPG
jgi:LPS sulfotransferase NodH